MDDSVVISKAIEKGFAHLCQTVARSNYLSALCTLANIGELTPEEFKKWAKPVLQLDHFTCNADFWDRENSRPLNEEEEDMTKIMKRNVIELYHQGKPTYEIAQICGIVEADVVNILEDEGLLR